MGMAGPPPKKGTRRTPAVLVNCYRLGFEVGYKGHSEIGWVSRRLNALLGLADRLGLKKLALQYYDKGKKDGVLKKNYDLQARFYKGEADERDVRRSPQLLWSLEQRRRDARFEGVSPASLKPLMLHRPRLMDIPYITRVPKRLFGLDSFNMTKHIRGVR